MLDERCPVVLLSGDEQPQVRAMRVVAPATSEERRGFVLLSGEQAADPAAVQQAIDATSSGVGVEVEVGVDVEVGAEVGIGTGCGLPHGGVVRVGLPRAGRIFCTWLVTLTAEDLVERVGTMSGEKLDQLTNALRLSRIE